MNGLKNGIRNGCAIEIFCGMFIVLIVTQCSCMSTTLPIEPEAAQSVNKEIHTYTLTAPVPAPITKVICLTADTVYMREGAGTGYEVVAVLSAGDVVTVTGGFVQSPDGGVWYPVTHGGVSGFMNARYLCER